jgi:hypothetical protein
MGDWAQSIVDVDSTGEEAAELGERLTVWLVDTGVIARELTDCALGSPLGHSPGTNYADAIGAAVDPPNLWTNGVEIGVGRTVYYTMDLQGVTCPRCGRYEELESEASRWHTVFGAALNDWYSGTSAGAIACPGCGAVNGLNDWDWGAHPYAFGELGVTFWNWHPLSQEFIAEVGRFLGHRVVYNNHKL